jgi:hypothetical protein
MSLPVFVNCHCKLCFFEFSGNLGYNQPKQWNEKKKREVGDRGQKKDEVNRSGHVSHFLSHFIPHSLYSHRSVTSVIAPNPVDFFWDLDGSGRLLFS